MIETPWVRSVYLYVMCAASIALVLVGLASMAIGAVHAIAPDLGHRDTLDRVGIGLSNIGQDVVELFNDTQLESIEEFCEDVTDSDDDFDECVEDEQAFSGEGLGSIQEGIAEVRDELRNQIRNNSIDRFLRGLVFVAAGWVLFRIHGRHTELFANGLGLKRIRGSGPSAVPGPTTTINPFSPPSDPPTA